MKIKLGRVVLGLVVTASTMVGALAMSLVGTPGASAQDNSAHVRVLHASPDAPAVDVWVNGSKALTNLAFKEISDWTSLPAGSYNVKVTPAGQTTAVIDADLSLEGGKYYTVAAVGKVADIKPQVYVDNLMDLEAGKARLRVVHASPDAPAVDVAVKGGPVLVSNLAFPSASDYLTVDPMTVDVEVRLAGTSTVALPVPGVTLEAGKVYTVFAVGLAGGSPALSVLPVVDNAMMTGAVEAGMPKTGAAESLALATLALLVASALAIFGGIAVRVRARK